MPKVSVYIPVYNGEKYLEEAVNSLLNQTFSDFELIIIDDGSTDETKQVALKLMNNDSRIKVISHTENKGLSAARNTGLNSVSDKSEYIMNHDCDDISIPDKLSALVEFLENNPEVSAVGSLCEYFNDNGDILGAPAIECSQNNILKTFDLFNSLCISGVLMRKKLVNEVAPFRKAFGGCDDYDFWARALLKGFVLSNIPRILHKIRLHENNMGRLQKTEMNLSAERIKKYFFKSRNDMQNRSVFIEEEEITLTHNEKRKYLFHAVYWGLRRKRLGIIKESYNLIFRD